MLAGDTGIPDVRNHAFQMCEATAEECKDREGGREGRREQVSQF